MRLSSTCGYRHLANHDMGSLRNPKKRSVQHRSGPGATSLSKAMATSTCAAADSIKMRRRAATLPARFPHCHQFHRNESTPPSFATKRHLKNGAPARIPSTDLHISAYLDSFEQHGCGPSHEPSTRCPSEMFSRERVRAGYVIALTQEDPNRLGP